MKFSKTLLIALAPLSLFMGMKSASGHAVQTDFQMRLDALEIQATFGDGEGFADAPVMVYTPGNPDEPMMVGRTDAEGKFSFEPDQELTGDWAIEIGDAETSHWDYLIVPVEETGVELDDISQTPAAESQPWHYHGFSAYSFVLILGSLGAIAASRFLKTTT